MISPAHRRVTLPAGRDVHVWTVPLDQPPGVCEWLRRALSDDEDVRAEKYVFERDRRRFVVCRGAVRVVLGACLDLPPGRVVFAYGDKGKPAIAGRTGVEFNVSHAGSIGVLAVARHGVVGVDVECLDRRIDHESLAGRFFSPDEAADLLSTPPEARRQAFFNGWTRKEAYIKAIGDGLSCPLHSFSVTLRPGDPVRMRRLDGGDPLAWHLQAFEPGPECVAAIATPWEPAALEIRSFSEPDTPWADGCPRAGGLGPPTES
jgi:4'-phosphopantetheinyl transferase